MPIEWQPKLAVGGEFIDDDHKKLITLINTYEQAIIDKDLNAIDRVFTEFRAYTEYHFEREELLMAAVHYPHLMHHKSQHQELIQALHDFHEQIKQRKHVKISEISAFFKHWLIDHVIKEDLQLKPYIQGGRHDELSELLNTDH